jgi:hypothetical protein
MYNILLEFDFRLHIHKIDRQFSFPFFIPVPPYSVRQQVMNSSYGNCMQTQPIAGTSDGGEPTAAGQMINHSDRDVASSGVGTANNIQQHHYLYQQQQPADSSGLPQNMITREEVNVSNF